MTILGESMLAASIETFRKRTILFWIITIVSLITIEALRGSYYWSKFKGNMTLFDYESSLHYFVAGQFALLNAILIYYLQRRILGKPVFLSVIPWVFIGVGGIFFAFDEMMEIHEKLGRRIEAADLSLLKLFPAGGDTIVTASYGLLAAAFFLFFFKRLINVPLARTYAYYGIGVVCIVGALDLVPKSLWINYVPFREIKELLEVLIAWLWGSAFITIATDVLIKIVSATYSPDT